MTDALREKLIHAGRVLVDEGQGDYVWGHISARLPDNPNRFLMKPGMPRHRGDDATTTSSPWTSRARRCPATGRATTRSTSIPR